ncbi:condensation domain-containing protein [Streptomyces sp. NPDC005811]|uniref:condensation domain-containing protein n=1 Tax=Streptomyces sp. NPDC005811 TaxID=3154565 RepID=UPI0033ECEBE8
MTAPLGLPLSAGQEAMWFLHRLAPDSAAYNVLAAVRVRTAVDRAALRRAVLALAGRHEPLRSVFVERGGTALRRHLPDGAVPFEVRELGDVPDERLFALARAAGAAPFDLSEAWPFRVTLLCRAPEDAVLVLAAHHIVTDATSQWLMLRDLLDAYAGRDLAPLPGSYGEEVERERRSAGTPQRESAERYWAEVQDGAAPATLTPDRPRPTGLTLRGATLTRPLPADTARRLAEAAGAAGVTPFAVLLGAFQSAVRRATGLDDFVIGCPASTRVGGRAAELVGYLVNSLPLRAAFTPDTTLTGAVAAAHRGLMEGLRRLRHPVRTPLFRLAVTLVAVDRLPVPGLLEPGGCGYARLRLELLDLPHMEGQFDLNVELRHGADALTLVLRYASDLYDLSTVERFADIYVRMIETAIEAPDTAVSDVPLVDRDQLSELLDLGAGGDW